MTFEFTSKHESQPRKVDGRLERPGIGRRMARTNAKRPESRAQGDPYLETSADAPLTVTGLPHTHSLE